MRDVMGLIITVVVAFILAPPIFWLSHKSWRKFTYQVGGKFTHKEKYGEFTIYIVELNWFNMLIQWPHQQSYWLYSSFDDWEYTSLDQQKAELL